MFGQTLPAWAGREREGEGEYTLPHATWIHSCILTISVDEGKYECQVGVSRE